MRRLRSFSIVVGILVDTVSSVALAIVYSLFVFGLQLDPGEPPTDDSAGLWNVAVTEILGLLPTVLGGFVAGRMAKALEVRHGVAVGMAALLVWVFVESVAPSDELPAWYRAISFIAVVPAGALGGYVAARRAKRPLEPTSGARENELS